MLHNYFLVREKIHYSFNAFVQVELDTEEVSMDLI